MQKKFLAKKDAIDKLLNVVTTNIIVFITFIELNVDTNEFIYNCYIEYSNILEAIILLILHNSLC